MTPQVPYKIILETLPDATIILDPQGKVHFMNQAAERLYGFRRENLQGRPLLTLPEDLKDEFLKVLAKVKEGEETVDWETKRLHKNGRVMEVSISLSYGQDGSWAQEFFIESSRDISGRLWWREKMLEVEKLTILGKLSASLAHQLNTPLSVALLKVERAKEALGSQSPLYQEMEGLKENLQSLRLSVQNTLGFVRKPVQERWPVELNSILKAVTTFYEPAFRQKKINCFLDIAATQGVKIYANSSEIETAISCLLMNSLEALSKGEIKLSTSILNTRELEISVEDNGPGIPQDVFSNIFEPFFTTKHYGTGLGLPIAKRIVEEHGGYILVESQEGKGTAVALRLPYLRTKDV
jgi:PAS domain S-box-containing protein